MQDFGGWFEAGPLLPLARAQISQCCSGLQLLQSMQLPQKSLQDIFYKTNVPCRSLFHKGGGNMFAAMKSQNGQCIAALQHQNVPRCQSNCRSVKLPLQMNKIITQLQRNKIITQFSFILGSSRFIRITANVYCLLVGMSLNAARTTRLRAPTPTHAAHWSRVSGTV